MSDIMNSYHGDHSEEIIQRWLPDDLDPGVYLDAHYYQGKTGQNPDYNHQSRASILIPSDPRREIIHEAIVNRELGS